MATTQQALIFAVDNYPVAIAEDTGPVIDTSYTVTLPPDISGGELLIVVLVHYGTYVAMTPPSGWTLNLHDYFIGAFQYLGSLAVYTKTAGAAEPDPAFTSAVSGVTIARSYKVTGSTGIIWTADSWSSESSNDPNPPAVGSISARSLAIALGVCWSTDAQTTILSIPSGYTNDGIVRHGTANVYPNLLYCQKNAPALEVVDPGAWDMQYGNNHAIAGTLVLKLA